MNTDTIADYLTRVRNASKANHRVVDIPFSKLKKEVTKVLYEKGYIRKYKIVGEGKDTALRIALKYDRITKDPAISSIQRISKPGLRKYCQVSDVPKVQNGLGISILSTSKGVVSDKEARTLHVGGEILCTVY